MVVDWVLFCGRLSLFYLHFDALVFISSKWVCFFLGLGQDAGVLLSVYLPGPVSESELLYFDALRRLHISNIIATKMSATRPPAPDRISRRSWSVQENPRVQNQHNKHLVRIFFETCLIITISSVCRACFVAKLHKLALSSYSKSHRELDWIDLLRITSSNLFSGPSGPFHLDVHIEFGPGMVGKGVLVYCMTSLRKCSIHTKLDFNRRITWRVESFVV